MYKEKIVSKLMIQDTNKDIFDGLFEILNTQTYWSTMIILDHVNAFAKCWRIIEFRKTFMCQKCEIFAECWSIICNYFGALYRRRPQNPRFLVTGAIDYVAFHRQCIWWRFHIEEMFSIGTWNNSILSHKNQSINQLIRHLSADTYIDFTSENLRVRYTSRQ